MARWLYSKIGEIKSPPPEGTTQPPKTPELLPVMAAYRSNIARLHAFWLLNPLLIQKSTVLLTNTYEALFKVVGHFPLTVEEKRDPEIKKKVSACLHETLANKARLAEEGKKSGLEKDIPGALKRFENYIEEDSGDLGLDDAIYATLSSLLTNGWTTFETLAADLWEAALNAHPSDLAILNGSPKRISKKADKRVDENDANTTPVDQNKQSKFGAKILARITQGTFDAGKVMGTLQKDSYRFNKLSGIREAYSAAFSKRHEIIDDVLIHQSLDKLSLVRNLILHKAGKVDQQFLDGIANISWDCKAEKDKLLPLNGEIVRDLLNPVFAVGWTLILAVDEWIHPPAKESNDVSARP